MFQHARKALKVHDRPVAQRMTAKASLSLNDNHKDSDSNVALFQHGSTREKGHQRRKLLLLTELVGMGIDH